MLKKKLTLLKTKKIGSCEGRRDVVGVVTLPVCGVAQDFHGDQVVELSLQLEVQEVEGKE